MSVNNFKPEIWSTKLLERSDANLVAMNIVNTDWEGEIRNEGTAVRINTIGSITIKDYDQGTPIDAPETVSSTQVILPINQKKYFNFAVDDVDAAQANITLLDKYTAQAGYDLAKVQDVRILSHYADVPPANIIGSDAAPITLTLSNIWNYVELCHRKLREANVIAPDVPPVFIGNPLVTSAMAGHKAKRETPFADEWLQLGMTTAGFTGFMFAGFLVYESNNIVVTPGTPDVANCLFGTRRAITFARQILKMEAYRPESGFKDAIKGLHVYGSKVVKPLALGVLKINNEVDVLSP